MRSFPPLLLALLSTTAWAGWADFDNAFPTLPCSDGWAGCVVDGQRVGGDLVPGDGAMAPADLRVDWFSLQALPAFSPYEGLSEYEMPEEVVAVLDPIEPPIVIPPDDGRKIIEDSRKTHPTDHKKVVLDKTDVVPNERKKVIDEPDGEGKETQKKIDSPGPIVATASCPPVKTMEPRAMMGKLTPADIGCLESIISGDSRQTAKDKASRPLMVNAWSRGDKDEWAGLVKRHMDEIDRSDPDLAYKYAQHLNRKGPGQADATIFWAENALDNRTMWTGPNYVKRTSGLYKLRARSAAKRWQYLAEQPDAQSDAKKKAEVDKWRLKTREFARAWYEYTVSAQLPSDRARALCISASTTEDACQVK